jgi:signal transduction histidine kinase
MKPMPLRPASHQSVRPIRRRLPVFVSMCLATAALTSPAWAQGSVATPSGPWVFATAALLVVAWIAWRAGQRDGARTIEAPPQASPKPRATDSTDDLQHVLLALCADLPIQLRLCQRDPDQREWRLVASSPPLPTGSTPFADIPVAVANAAARLTRGGQAEVDGWLMRSSGDAADEWLVLRQGPPGGAGGEDPAAFSFTVSHDLRAPVRVVEGFARILKEDYGRQLDRIGNDHVDRILAAAARMNAMIDAMLSVARISSQPIARQPVNLSQLATYVLDDLKRAQPERDVRMQIEPGLQATGDPTLLRQVLENLLSNAWKYSARCDAAEVSFSATQRDGRRVFEVRDNGAGFDMRSAERLFGLFQRLHSATDFPGTGVGLASVQRIVRRHGGEIWAEAEPGHGARFYFTLSN